MEKDSRRFSFKVKELSSFGIQTVDIAKYLGISKEELVQDYSDILNTAATDRTVEVAHKLYELAMEGNVQSAIYWLKSIGKWDEIAKSKEEVTKDDALEAIRIEIIPNKDEAET